MQNERNEIFTKIKHAAQCLQHTSTLLNAQLLDNDSDIADISNDAYDDLVAMLNKLSKDYDIAIMSQDALEM